MHNNPGLYPSFSNITLAMNDKTRYLIDAKKTLTRTELCISRQDYTRNLPLFVLGERRLHLKESSDLSYILFAKLDIVYTGRETYTLHSVFLRHY